MRRPWPTGGCCTKTNKNELLLKCLDYIQTGHVNVSRSNKYKIRNSAGVIFILKVNVRYN
jgi:hypothetical protein